MFGGSVKDNVAANKNFAYLFDSKSVNRATPGSCMERKPATATTKFASGFQKISAIKKYSGTGKYFVEFGANDILFNSPYSTTGYIRDFRLYIEAVLASGVPKDSIVIMYNLKINPGGFKFYNKKVGMPIPDQHREPRYNDATLGIIKRYQTDSFNVGAVFESVPIKDRANIYLGDSLHPSDLGHWYLAQALINKFKAKKPVGPLYDTIPVKVEYWLKERITHDTLIRRDSIRYEIRPRTASRAVFIHRQRA